MSGLRPRRKHRLAGKIGAAAVIATLTGVPQDLAHWMVGDQLGGASVAFAATKPKPPPPPPPPPPPTGILPQPLNLDPDVHWFAAWDENTAPGAPDFFPSPSNLTPTAGIQAVYNATPVNKPLGLKIQVPVPGADATALFNTTYTGGRPISYIFSDNETGSAAEQIANVTALVSQVRASTVSKNAYIGHFGLTPLNMPDRYRRGPLPFTKMQYNESGVNMANTQAYPGQGDFRNASTGDWANANIRTGLFIGPIGRVTDVQNALNTGNNGKPLEVGVNNHKQIPWVARFNNWGNSSLDTNGIASDGFRFEPGVPLASNPSLNTTEQMLGRGDFSAQILHYRMRGVYSVNLFHEGGASGQVENYSAADAKQDVRDGWYGIAHVNGVFSASDNKPVTMTLNPIVDGSTGGMTTRAEQTGVIWSGQYSLSKKQLDILASNLDTADHMLRFGSGDTPYEMFTIQNDKGYTYKDAVTTSLEDGIHKIFEFDLVKTRIYDTQADMDNKTKKYTTKTIWLLNNSYQVFGNNGGRATDVGIPEPTTFGMLAAAGSMAVVCRRQRRQGQPA
jgi:hypothetical protein